MGKAGPRRRRAPGGGHGPGPHGKSSVRLGSGRLKTHLGHGPPQCETLDFLAVRTAQVSSSRSLSVPLLGNPKPARPKGSETRPSGLGACARGALCPGSPLVPAVRSWQVLGGRNSQQCYMPLSRRVQIPLYWHFSAVATAMEKYQTALVTGSRNGPLK